MEEMQGEYLLGKKMKISHATPKTQNTTTLPSSNSELQQYQLVKQDTIQDQNDSQNTTLYVGGIDDSVDEAELIRQFNIFGTILCVKIAAGKKCGFVQFSTREEAERAMQDMNGTVIGMNRVRVSWGKQQGVTRGGVTPPQISSTIPPPVIQTEDKTSAYNAQVYAAYVCINIFLIYY